MRYGNMMRQLLALILVLAGVAGCADTQKRGDVVDQAQEALDQAIETNQQTGSVPESVSSALLPTINLSQSKLPEVKGEQKFDISVNEVPAAQFFMSLVDGTPYNMVVHPEVSGTITLNLQDVTIPDVLEAVRDVYGYEFVSTPYGFQVLPGRLQARIYQINYINVARSGRSSTLVSSGALTSTRGSNRNSGSSSADRSTGSNSGSSNNTSAIFGTQIQTLQPETSFWKELQSSIVAIVGQGEGRNVVVNPQSGVVVVRALPTELREVETFLQATQLIVQRQVILEAKIIEVRLNDLYQAGINWAGLLKPDNKEITIGQIGGGSVLVDEAGLSGIAGNTGNLDPANLTPIVGTATEAFGGVFTLATKLGDFSTFLELLGTQGNVQILSSPRVATLNNQKAVIKVGQDEFFVTEVSTQNVSTSAATTIIPDVQLTPFFSGIALDVTPQISESGEVILHVHPSISDVVDQQKTVTVGTVTQQLPLALSTVRETDSIVRARSGQVIIIGGLMQDVLNDADAGVPGLKDAPGVGRLFRHEKNKTSKSELVILLRPIVVDNDASWTGELQKSADGIKRLKDKLE